MTIGGGGQVTVAATVTQSTFGIKPYSAMLGTLKINDDVEIVATGTLPLA